ncbi:hypothetical protein M6D93_08820 [Jatrophihabitans telluris]|uniref:Uncharacterized protein n=1 Tax=Jatrophihabitans telluris TaxID=2038343 RepID=A0ABY4R434_9ACTN|nr:hypothetical protein [Jatrophihabitans telluris]UQX90088.1 hypothetical protein M6D93_08820 [Jatrophihabitans telluris]
MREIRPRPAEAIPDPLPPRQIEIGDGQVLTVRSLGEEIGVEVRTVGASPHTLAHARFPDHFGDSEVSVHPHPLRGQAVIWVSAGQDGTQSWLAHIAEPVQVGVEVQVEGQVEVEVEVEVQVEVQVEVEVQVQVRALAAEDCGPARFGPDGRWFLACDDLVLRRISWPAQEELGVLAWPQNTRDEPGPDVHVLPGGYACWPSENGRLHIIDLRRMSIVEEVVLAGHPVRTVGEIFPRLAGDDTPCSDIEATALARDADTAKLLLHHRGGPVSAVPLRELSPEPERPF